MDTKSTNNNSNNQATSSSNNNKDWYQNMAEGGGPSLLPNEALQWQNT